MYRLIWHEDLLDLAREVYERTYRPTTSTCFIVTRPKLREVFAANFRDRIVQHWLCLRLEPLFEARLLSTEMYHLTVERVLEHLHVSIS